VLDSVHGVDAGVDIPILVAPVDSVFAQQAGARMPLESRA
jgi:hypothetical protein